MQRVLSRLVILIMPLERSEYFVFHRVRISFNLKSLVYSCLCTDIMKSDSGRVLVNLETVKSFGHIRSHLTRVGVPSGCVIKPQVSTYSRKQSQELFVARGVYVVHFLGHYTVVSGELRSVTGDRAVGLVELL